jgi:hypothetical protein
MSTAITELYPYIRATLGDFHTTIKRYDDSAILSVVRREVRMGKLPGYELTPDVLSITPALATVRDWALIILRSSLTLLLPNVASYAYDTRELKERFGEQLPFLVSLQEALFDEENTEGFGVQQSLVDWINGMTGLNVYGQLSALLVNAPIATVSVGPNGISASG